MIDASQVSAVLVTKGDVDLEPILATLPYEDVVIWNNAEHAVDMKTLGRHLAEAQCKNDVVYHQDDDLLFRNHEALLAEYVPGRITANMPSPWYEKVQYAEKRQVMLGGGSLVDKGLTKIALSRYLERYALDDDLLVYCDCIVGALTPSHRIDVGFEALPQCEWENRISTQPGCWDRKARMDARAFEIRGY